VVRVRPTSVTILSDGEVVYEKDGCIEVSLHHSGTALEISISEKEIVATDFNDICCCEDGCD
jgi:hypothetical protein